MHECHAHSFNWKPIEVSTNIENAETDSRAETSRIWETSSSPGTPFWLKTFTRPLTQIDERRQIIDNQRPEANPQTGLGHENKAMNASRRSRRIELRTFTDGHVISPLSGFRLISHLLSVKIQIWHHHAVELLTGETTNSLTQRLGWIQSLLVFRHSEAIVFPNFVHHIF